MPSPLRRYAVFYFCFYAALGAYTPYVARFVDHLGFSGLVAGGMLGLWYASRIVAPPLWSRMVAQSARPGLWLLAGCVLASLGFASFGAVSSVTGLFAAMLFFGAFYNAVMPQFEAMTLGAIAGETEGYGRLRVWGSVGFLVVAGSYGALLDAWGEAWFVWATLPWFALMVWAAWPFRNEARSGAATGTVRVAMRELWNRPGTRPLLLLALLVQAGFGAFYVFYTLHLRANGHDGLAVGLLWMVGVFAEIVLFWWAPGLIRRHGVHALMALCLGLTVARWIVVALFPASMALMVAAQLTHALGFALFHACLMQRMAALFPGHEASAGQGLLYGFSSGLGGVVGALLAAVLWEWQGGVAAFLGGAALTAAGLGLHLLRRTEPRPNAAKPAAP
ncbi:MFS transporter [Silanimonas sp.]|jgi:PPP family 3-phenylpropionic acid transporter|uniref:MFS transporter n=1 Tax=Silanimonas sp. TaxID=1929290 RepID=UPI0037C58B60